MTRYLVNNVEQIQPGDIDGTLFHLHCRDIDGDYQMIEVNGFSPYFYVLEDECKEKEEFLHERDIVKDVNYGEYSGFGVDSGLAKVTVGYPQDVPEARQHFNEHFAADIPFTRRFRIDAGIRDVIEVESAEVHWTEVKPVETSEFDDLEPRIVTLDIEADDSSGFPNPKEDNVLSIVTHDNYTDDMMTWLYTDSRDVSIELEGTDVTLAPTQIELFESFTSWINKYNPDLIAGWNSNDFDIPYIIERMETVGVDPKKLSRDGWSGIDRGNPRIKGRTCYDLMQVYSANSDTELRSLRLEDIASVELRESKIEFKGGYTELWEDDPNRFLEYNKRDVELTVGINEEARITKFRDSLRRQVGVDFGDSLYNKDFIDMLVRRKLKEWDLIPPSRPEYGEEPEGGFEGARVIEPYIGVAENVVALDIASLYPYTMAILNSSPETKVDGSYSGPKTKGANGQHFALDKKGVFPALVDDALSLKTEYKEIMREATGKDKKFWEVQYHTAKTITNSLYGVCGWTRFFLYDEDVAEAVTVTSQELLRVTEIYVNGKEQNFEVIYGDTDSVYIEFPDMSDAELCIDTAERIAKELNGSVYPALAEQVGAEECLWEMEVEAFMESYFQAGKKKRYAYVATWKDGEWIDDPEPKIVGFEYRRSDSAQLTADLQHDVFDVILSGNPEDVSDIISGAAEKVKSKEDLEYIGIPQGLRQRINPDRAGKDGYYAFSVEGNYPQDAHPRACYNANCIIGTDFGIGDKPKRIYLNDTYIEEVEREIDVIAYDKEYELRSLEPLDIDIDRMIKTIITKPLEEVVSAIDVDVKAAIHGQQQVGLGAFS